MVLSREELLSELRAGAGEDSRRDPAYAVFAALAGVELEARKAGDGGRWELFAPAGVLDSGTKDLCRRYRDGIVRAVWMKKALEYLTCRGAFYVPSELDEELDRSYGEDDLDTFREVLREWTKAFAVRGNPLGESR